MSSFPPRKWDVRSLRDMDSLTCPEPEGNEINMEAYLAIKPSAGEEGSFQFALAGGEPIRLKFNVEAVIPSGLFGGMKVEAELKIGDQIKMDKNSVCSQWMDVAALVQSQDITITDGLGEDAADDFLVALEAYKKELKSETGSAARAGICLRWLLGTVVEDKQILLIAQVINPQLNNSSLTLIYIRKHRSSNVYITGNTVALRYI